MSALPDPIRRRLFLGAGSAAVLGTGLLAGPASAAPTLDPVQPTPDPVVPEGPTAIGPGAPAQMLASPVLSTIASARRNGYVYRTVGEFDFSVESELAERKFGTKGVYSSGAQTSMWASVDLPAGALFRDIEMYAFNNSGTNAYGSVWLWSASDGYLSAQLATVTIPSSNQLVAVRSEVTAANYGPYPTATKLFITLYTTADAKLQINGARVGMTGGGATLGFLDSPARIYDSRSSSRFGAGEARLITVPASVAPRGCVGIAANVTVAQTLGPGYLLIWPGHSSEPASSALNYGANTNVANALPVGISAAGQFWVKVYNSPTHVIIDVSGTYS